MLEDILESKKSGLRVLILRYYGAEVADESLIKKLEDQGVRVVREKEDLHFDEAVSRMNEILAEEKRVAERLELARR